MKPRAAEAPAPPTRSAGGSGADGGSPSGPVHYRRSPDLLLEWQDEAGPVLVDCRRWRRFTARPRLLALLNALDRPLTTEEIHARWGGSAPNGEGNGEAELAATQRALDQLSAAGIIRSSAHTVQAPQGLTPYELAAHARAGHGPAANTQQGSPPPARLRHPDSTETVRLTDSDELPSRPLREVLTERRSIRDFASSPLPLGHLAVFLARSARVRGPLGPLGFQQTQRPSPSGGGRHSVETYVIARKVSGLTPGAYHYDPFDHTLNRLAPWDDELAAVLNTTVTMPAYMEHPPPASLLLASHAARTGWKYEGLALSLIYRDAGCLLQTLCLTATDLGLGACPTGTMRPANQIAFLKCHHDGLLHVGNLALGIPGPDRDIAGRPVGPRSS
ncbi:SagB/ThcOx family dehydrogenase [Streptomyces sp. WAC 01529]|uniref:SagB/ThcOx family dehydrogenase n=1 Tax=Streptomyces sp. WAC 01529 TaxID=2203205 RepID=UPI001F0B9DEB|nr:SagB/ThcOx family dehydrogenase [Streptomyces sp. WAC 01529]